MYRSRLFHLVSMRNPKLASTKGNSVTYKNGESRVCLASGMAKSRCSFLFLVKSLCLSLPFFRSISRICLSLLSFILFTDSFHIVGSVTTIN